MISKCWLWDFQIIIKLRFYLKFGWIFGGWKNESMVFFEPVPGLVVKKYYTDMNTLINRIRMSAHKLWITFPRKSFNRNLFLWNIHRVCWKQSYQISTKSCESFQINHGRFSGRLSTLSAKVASPAKRF